MGKRIIAMNKTIERLSPNLRYTMIKHEQRKRAAPRIKCLLRATAETRFMEDGLNISNQWSILSVEQRPLYYHLFVNVGKPSVFWRIDSCIL
uniref:Uncharacterized protein n=1 Tax=Panagrolaimus davidi TaxID=227884 RepID=A0A914Q958_9BILA